MRVMCELASGRFATINIKRRCTASLTARGDGGEERVAPEDDDVGMLIRAPSVESGPVLVRARLAWIALV